MIAGGAGSRIHPTVFVRSFSSQLSRRCDEPAKASRPFDAKRDGLVNGEGAAAFVLEDRQRAEARGATILARIAGSASAFEPRSNGCPAQGVAIRSAITKALRAARMDPADIGHVNAHGLSTIDDDRIEARAIRDTLGDIPVTAPKSFFGTLGSGAGAVEMAVSVLALGAGIVPVTLNYERPDPACPVNVVHGSLLTATKRTALLLNHTPMGQSAALVLAGP